MEKNKVVISSGNGCLGSLAMLLTVLFVALKLTNVIDWGWGWVLSPLWISFLGGCAFLIVFYFTFRRFLK